MIQFTKNIRHLLTVFLKLKIFCKRFSRKECFGGSKNNFRIHTMKIFAVYLFVFVGLLGSTQPKPNKVIFIQPLGEVNPQSVDKVKSAVESFFGFRCVVRSRVELAIDILAASKTRYEAGKIIDLIKDVS